MNIWPKESELEDFYGKFTLDDTGYPSAIWKFQHLTQIEPAYPMVLAWDESKKVKRITCHEKIAVSLTRILQQLADEFKGRYEETGINRFAGVYEFRRVSGSSKLSLHAYGAAIDLDPARNGRGVPYDGGINMIPQGVIDIFKAEGWKWGGDFRVTDAMHFQAGG